MKNLRITVPLVNGDLFPLEFDSGKELIHTLVSDDWGPPPTCLRIEATTEDGKTVTISIPYSESNKVGVWIES